MGQLYPADKHCDLRLEDWSEDRVRHGIREIVRHEVESFDAQHLWPTHPLDGDNAYGTGYYMGAGGVLWGMSFLHREQLIEEVPDWFSTQLDALVQLNKIEFYPPGMPSPARSYLFGDIPLLMLQSVDGDDDSLLDQIFARLEQSTEGPVSELMWGVPGNMIATMHMSAATGESRWLGLYRDQAEKTLKSAAKIDGVGYHWVHELYGQQHDGLGSVHGFAGYVYALLAGIEHLSQDTQTHLIDRISETLLATVTRSAGRANWPRSPSVSSDWRLYHCHGAPGIISSLGRYPAGASAKLEQTLLEAGELIYEAGPLRKGPTLCHGTAGNGFAFLNLFERTGDEKWLARAREFAMHSLWQVELSRELFGQARHTLWTGDIGVAAYLCECLRATARFPTIDVF